MAEAYYMYQVVGVSERQPSQGHFIIDLGAVLTMFAWRITDEIGSGSMEVNQD